MAAPITMPNEVITVDEVTGKPVTASDILRERIDEVLERFAEGETCASIAESFSKTGQFTSSWLVRKVMREQPEWAARYDAALSARAHQLMERTLNIAQKAEQLGDAAGLRVAADTYFKLAAKLAPAELGEKATVNLNANIKQSVESLSDEQLALIAAQGITP